MSIILKEDINNILAADLQWERFKGATVLITGATGMLGG